MNSFRGRGASRFHSVFPFSRSRQIVRSWSRSAAVTKIRDSVNTGDECPGGSAVRHTTFWLGPIRDGTRVESETPEPFGPRNCGQSAAVKAPLTATHTNNVYLGSAIMLRLPELRHRWGRWFFLTRERAPALFAPLSSNPGVRLHRSRRGQRR